MVQEQLNIHSKNMKFDLYPTPYIKINSNSIINLNVKHKTIMVLEGRKGKILQDLGLSENSLGQQSMTHKRKEINKWNPSKLKRLLCKRPF